MLIEHEKPNLREQLTNLHTYRITCKDRPKVVSSACVVRKLVCVDKKVNTSAQLLEKLVILDKHVL